MLNIHEVFMMLNNFTISNVFNSNSNFKITELEFKLNLLYSSLFFKALQADE